LQKNTELPYKRVCRENAGGNYDKPINQATRP
jgi:hypothetical protein